MLAGRRSNEGQRVVRQIRIEWVQNKGQEVDQSHQCHSLPSYLTSFFVTMTQMLQGSLKNNQALPGFLLHYDSMGRTVFGKSYFITSIGLTLVRRWSIQFFLRASSLRTFLSIFPLLSRYTCTRKGSLARCSCTRKTEGGNKERGLRRMSKCHSRNYPRPRPWKMQ